MTSAANTRGFNSVLAILTGLDVLTGVHGAMYASVIFDGASPIAGWPWFAWLFAGSILALPILSVAGPAIAWLMPKLSRVVRLSWAASPIAYAMLLSIAMEVMRLQGMM